MGYDFLYFIEKNEKPKSLSSAVAHEVEKDSSNCVSHDTHTFTIKQEVWTVSMLELEKARIVSRSTNRAQEVEGNLILGQWPKLDDGQGRIVFSFMELRQLQIVPSKWQYAWGDNALICVRCFQVGNVKFPLGVGFSHEEPEQWDSALEALDDDLENISGSINFQAFATYIPPRDCIVVLPYNVVKSGSRLGSFMTLQLRQESVSLCSCNSRVFITHVTITLVEYLQFKVARGEGFEVEKKFRTVTLKDCKTNFQLLPVQLSKELGGDVFSTRSLFNCELPNLGPTFHSNECSRTYLLKIDLQARCTLNKQPCTANLSTLLDIEVGLETELSKDSTTSNEIKECDFVSVDQFPNDPMVVQDIFELVVDRCSKMSWTLGHQICVLYQKENVFVVTTIYLSSKSELTQDNTGDKNDANENKADLALVASNGKWGLRNRNGSLFGSVIREFSLPLMKDFQVDSGFDFADFKSENVKASHNVGISATPGTCIDSNVRFSIRDNYVGWRQIYFAVELEQQTNRSTPQGETSFKKTFRLINEDTHLRLGFKNEEYFGDVQNIFNLFKIPEELEPSLYSNTLHRSYQLTISFDVRTGTRNYRIGSIAFDLIINEADRSISADILPPCGAQFANKPGDKSCRV